MIELALSAGFAVLVWWLGTGIVLFLNGRSVASHPAVMLGSSVVLILALMGLHTSSADATVSGALCAFTCGVLVWSWFEISYLLGWVTGPRSAPCPHGVGTARRFWLALQTSIYHELAIVAGGIGLYALTLGAPNRVGLWTFCVLWAMRWSAKLNIFLGVKNLNEEWLPAHLRYLVSYFGKPDISLLFPVSVTISSVVAAVLVSDALGSPAGSFEATANAIIAAFLMLAIVEHWFLVLSVPDAALWHWASRQEQRGEHPTINRKHIHTLAERPAQVTEEITT